MSQRFLKDHKGSMSSPVTGMNMGNWLQNARKTESQLEGLLTRTTLDGPQRTKVEHLLYQIRCAISKQLERINQG